MTHDLVIRGGNVVDGSGKAPYRADVAIDGDRIVAVGSIDQRGREELDAEGHLVAPGFIDTHTHLDAQVCWDPFGPSAWHGVTTVVIGNCGFTLAPAREAEKDLVLRTFERAEDIPRAALLEGIDWQWESYADYLAYLRRLPKGINFAGMVGHSAVRTYVMGERAFEEQATDDEIADMAREVEAALRAGAIGFSTSRSAHHFTSSDQPVASRLATWDEVTALVDVMKRLDRGMLEIIEADLKPDAQARAERRQRMADFAVWFGRVTIPAIGGRTADILAASEGAHARGGQMVTYATSKSFDSMIGFRAKLPFDSLPGWREVRSLPIEQQIAVFRDTARRSALVNEAMTTRSGSEIGAEARPPVYDQLFIIDSGVGPHRSVAEVAAERGVSPVDVIVDDSLATDFHRLFAQSLTEETDFLATLRHPLTVWGASDAGAHLSQVVEYSVPTYFLAHWVRDQQAFTWEEAVHILSTKPATVCGFHDRGRLGPGYAADLIVFDPERVGRDIPYAANDLPGGATRLIQKAVGIRSVVVGGRETLHDSEPTGDYPGSVLTGSSAPA